MSVVHSTEAVTLGNTLGALFLGVIFSAILFGVSSLQVYYYYHYYPHDTLLHKCSVGLLWCLDATHLALTIFSTYHYGVLGFGDVAGLAVVSWSIKLHTAVNVVIILLVQSLYAYRVWLLSGYHHGVLGYLVAAVVLAGFAIGIVLAYETYSIPLWSAAPTISWAIQASFAASTAIDVVISVAMCFYLRKSKGRESRLNSRISTLMQYTLSCGVFTSACSLSCLFTFILMPNNLVFLALTYILTRLYVNSFMAMMNARQRAPRPADSDALALTSNTHTNPVFTYGYGSPVRSVGDYESQRPRDKYDVDVGFDFAPAPLPLRTLSDTHTRTLAHADTHTRTTTTLSSDATAKPEYAYAYTRNW
ncbi:hypothetical protein C8R44DRAFT_189790 [Mycena epipterygia]|nr:hypothetical protein C8R44DRAFT_189790 [Mycena epipterygia]